MVRSTMDPRIFEIGASGVPVKARKQKDNALVRVRNVAREEVAIIHRGYDSGTRSLLSAESREE